MVGSHSEHILSFGKYGLGKSGERCLAAVPNTYLNWLLDQDFFVDSHRDFEAVNDECEWRKSQSVYVED
ncbi:MAG: hypothetical protein FVQ80_06695 [Planctomycetes bacterium]|nr:hypothetical protein [Planctomycetota bacterium]